MMQDDSFIAVVMVAGCFDIINSIFDFPVKIYNPSNSKTSFFRMNNHLSFASIKSLQAAWRTGGADSQESCGKDH